MVDRVGSYVSFTFEICVFYQHVEVSVGDHPRGWSRPYAQTVATIRAYGRQQTHSNVDIFREKTYIETL